MTANTNVQLDGTNVTALNKLTYYRMGEGIITLSKVSFCVADSFSWLNYLCAI